MSSFTLTPLSSIEGRIEILLVTLPPASDQYIDHYYHELVSTFKDRESVIRFRNYEPPRHPNRPLKKQHFEELDFEDRLHSLMGGRKVLSFLGGRDFLEDYVGELIEFMKLGFPIANSEWAQDPFSVLQSANGSPVLLQPLFSDRYMDKFISLALAANPELDALIKPTNLLIEGGNILSCGDLLLVGKDLLAQNILRRLKKSEGLNGSENLIEEIERSFLSEFGCRHIYWVGFEKALPDLTRENHLTYQPAFHIDLFLTCGGRQASGQELLFCGDPSLSVDLLSGKVPPAFSRISPAILENFALFRSTFENKGPGSFSELPDIDIVSLPIYMYRGVTYSYNNCLVESFAGKRIAYLPNYLVSDEDDRYHELNPVFRLLQQATEEIFLRHGFTQVNWIGPAKFFRTLSQMRGSLHCITKVLKRSSIQDHRL